ncbi:hypothetical protein [Pseudoalteromonas sp. GABNS16H]|uniref:hypothetical protein n=1 Tax=Pseudoalteromonas sp. GABNS16H TaxID=3025325 RepID=UPI002360DF89|nr:hypothetical protein [Pseudoalteromonas sp. GABNS16H]MDC9611657.1 hypothetical protein [Pseudoalteromonas sp. GABNS16H]
MPKEKSEEDSEIDTAESTPRPAQLLPECPRFAPTVIINGILFALSLSSLNTKQALFDPPNNVMILSGTIIPE